MTTTNLEKRELGKTGIKITPIGLGAMQFSGGSMGKMMFEDIDQERMNSIVKAALDGGISWFDTAEMYGRGRSEAGLSNALQSAGIADKEVGIATKWFPVLRSSRNIQVTINDRIKFLYPYSIDLYQVHNPMSFSTPEDEMNAMADLVEKGLIRSVGVCNFSALYMRRAHKALEMRGLTLASNQVQYSLLNRKIESSGVLETAKEIGITIIAWSPLASGLLSGKFHKDPGLLARTPFGRRMMLKRKVSRSFDLVRLLDQIAEKYNVTTSQVALNWLINSNGDTVVAIPGASKVHHAEEAAGVMKFRLSDDDMKSIDRASRDFL
ncbi:MAG TPA: aldo/keto reductase [Bacteroidales bacterium]|nr:aldo/keto reductase [Bacteroidales bacterium]